MKDQLHASDREHVAGCQAMLTGKHFAAEKGSVAAPQIANNPAGVGKNHLGVLPARPLIADHDLVGRGGRA